MQKENGQQTTSGIPYSLAPCFQEYNLDDLNLTDHRALIIERVLAWGNRQEIRWLFECYGREQIGAWVREFGQRRLPWRRYNLWCVLLDLPPAVHRRPEASRIWLH